MPRRFALIALAAVLVACTNGDAGPKGTVAEQQDVATFDDDRTTFAYPAEFEVAHQGEGGEFSVRIESSDGGDPAEATIFALWAFGHIRQPGPHRGVLRSGHLLLGHLGL